MITLGYLLGGVPVIRHNFEKVVLVIIAISLLPAVLQMLGKKKVPTATIVG
jgi:hypothetical protein